MNIKYLFQLYRNMGGRYFFYRFRHEVEKETGLLKKRHPTNLKLTIKVPKGEWIQQYANESFLSHSDHRDSLKLTEDTSTSLKIKAERILSGELEFFNAEWLRLGLSYDWISNPVNNYRYDISKHWSEIPDFSQEAGDIKYVWEKSRFSWLLTLIRYDNHFKIDLSEFVFSEIESWIEHNPINLGPNWRCSQEISLRIFNWFIALSYYKDADALTDRRWEKIQDVIFASLHHVYHHIDFSRIAVRNNHAITETMFLALSEILFPYIAETKKWSSKGRKWFEEEIDYQIYEDGTFLQFSMNYHRVVIQLLTLGISISEKANNPFSQVVYERAYKSTEFLYQCLQEESGWLPNYGSNDGALFFPWSDTDYRDYRPQLNSLHYLLTGEYLFNELAYSEEVVWWGLSPSNIHMYSKIDKFIGIKEYPIGGYVLIRDSNSFTFVRCGSHKDRPAQADNLHIDIWVDGINVLRDSGTYKYNTSADLSNYFTGTQSHNTVLVNDNSQMLKGSRFIWYYWSQKMSCEITENKDYYCFKGKIRAYSYLNKKAFHSRIIKKLKDVNVWIVEDEIGNLDQYAKKQLWHFQSKSISIHGIENKIEIPSEQILSYNSNYYGVLEEGMGIVYPFERKIKTTIEIK